MEAQKHSTLVTLVSVLVIVSFVSSEPHDTLSTNAQEHERNGPSEENIVCSTEVCKRRASIINDYLDNDTDPCDDFYGYVCNNWIRNHTTNGSYDAFQMLHHQFFGALTDILQSTTSTHSRQEVVDKPAVLYEACMNFTKENESTDILKLMSISNFKEWPLTSQVTEKADIFNNASAVLSYVGMSPLMHYYIWRNGATRLIMILPLGIGGIPDRDHIENAVKSVKSDIEENDLNNFTEGLQNLHKEWLKVAPEEIMLRPARPVGSKIENLDQNYTNIPLYDLLQKDFSKVPEVNLTKQETVIVSNMKLYEAINTFLNIANPQALYNYMGLHTMLHWLSRSPLRTEDEQRKPGRCAGLVYSAMIEVVSLLYAQKYFTTGAKMEVEKIVLRIKDAYEEAINNTEWMDEKSKEIAQKTLKGLVGKIGYPMWVLNITVLQKLYEYVPDLYPNMSFFNMMHEIDENSERKTVKKLRETHNEYMEWFYSPSTVNAYFNFQGNYFVYPLGGLQPPFFESGLPWSLNFGGTGTVIAHEITHALARASPFYKYHAMMHLKNNTKLNKFDERLVCFEHQYGNITEEKTNVPLNGTKALDENMADNSGLQMALRAYQKLVIDECGNATTSLDGLPDKSGLKLFFIGYGMSWCSAITQEALKNKIAYDTHSPNMYRVNIPLQNSEAFATTFNCTRQSPMFENSTHKCTLW